MCYLVDVVRGVGQEIVCPLDLRKIYLEYEAFQYELAEEFGPVLLTG